MGEIERNLLDRLVPAEMTAGSGHGKERRGRHGLVLPAKNRRGHQRRSPGTKPRGQKININTATKEQLDLLPEIGGVKAQAIIDGRPYQKIEDIMKVKGIKEGIFAKIKDSITVN